METKLNQKAGILQKLEATSPTQLVNLPEVADRFKRLYHTFNGRDGVRYYEAEKFHFAKILQENAKLAACSKLSLYGVFLDMAVNGLSFDPAMKHAYIIPYNHNVGTRNAPKWESRAQLQISGQGELILRANQGQIKHADNPILVYEGDEFSHGTRNGAVFVDHTAMFPRKSDNIIACYIRIERNDGSVDYKVLSIEEVMKLRKFSKDPDSKAWTDGLPGMVQAKTIKHAFKSYPKLRILDKSKFTQLASDAIDQEPEFISEDIYGLADEPTGHTEDAEAEVIPSAPVSVSSDSQPVTSIPAADYSPLQNSETVTHDDTTF